jgi:hypothetical protein
MNTFQCEMAVLGLRGIAVFAAYPRAFRVSDGVASGAGFAIRVESGRVPIPWRGSRGLQRIR